MVVWLIRFSLIYFKCHSWWEELVAKENVSFVPVDPPLTVFLQQIKVIHRRRPCQVGI
jgi:hypothetical protein